MIRLWNWNDNPPVGSVIGPRIIVSLVITKEAPAAPDPSHEAAEICPEPARITGCKHQLRQVVDNYPAHRALDQFPPQAGRDGIEVELSDRDMNDDELPRFPGFRHVPADAGGLLYELVAGFLEGEVEAALCRFETLRGCAMKLSL